MIKLAAYNKKYRCLRRTRRIPTKALMKKSKPVSKPAPVIVALPKTYGECAKMRKLNGGPCHRVGCKWHVFTILPFSVLNKINRGEIDDDELLEKLLANETCVLTVADRRGDILENIGQLMWMSRERIRQVEEVAICKLRHKMRRDKLIAFTKDREVKQDDEIFCC